MGLAYEARSQIVSVAPTNQTTAGRTPTLGELLYADPTIALVSEKEWLTIVRAIAAGDQAALRTLSEKAFPVVFTYLMQLTGNRHLTDALILDVFQMVWCEAPVFDTKEGPVLGWIMRQARSLALTHARSGTSAHSDTGDIAMEMSADPIPIGDSDYSPRASVPLLRALEALTVDEREAIEATVLKGLSYSEFAMQCGQPSEQSRAGSVQDGRRCNTRCRHEVRKHELAIGTHSMRATRPRCPLCAGCSGQQRN